MLTLNVLNSDASLNSFKFIDTFNFIGGEDIKLVMRLFQTDEDIRYIPDTGATITLDFRKSDDTVLVKAATFPFADDRSIIEVNITALESADLITQNLVAKLDEGGSISYAILQTGFRRTSLTVGCA